MSGEQFMRAVLNAPPGTRAKIEMLLNGDDTVAPPPIADARTCSQSEAARRLGVSRSTAIAWMRSGQLRSINVGGVPRVLLASIDEIARGQVSATDNPLLAKRILARSAQRADAGRRGAAARERKRAKEIAA